MEQILLVEDDRDYAITVAEILTDEGYIVDVCYTSREAIEAIREKEHDLIIADLNLDTISGVQLAEIIRREHPHMPVVILTGSVSDDDEVHVLDVGINDYIRKTVSFKVFLGRVKHVLEMQNGEEHAAEDIVSQKEKITIDVDSRTVFKEKEKVHLTVLEYDLLIYLLKNKNRVLSREELIKKVWKISKYNDIDFRIVDSFIKNLRNKLDIKSIYSIRGIGYRWYE